MNRIERLIWEETQLKDIEHFQRGSLGMTAAKLILIAMLVGLVALLASRVSLPPLDDAVVRALAPTSLFYTPVAASDRAGETGTSEGTLSHDAAGEANRAAPQSPTKGSHGGKRF